MFGKERRSRRSVGWRTGEQGRSDKPPLRRRGRKGERKETCRIRSGDRTWDKRQSQWNIRARRREQSSERKAREAVPLFDLPLLKLIKTLKVVLIWR